MTWAEHHADSEQFAAQAELAIRLGDRQAAEKLYRKAAEAEERALHDLPPTKAKTFGITAVSASALWFKGGDLDAADRVIVRALATPGLPTSAAVRLRQLRQLGISQRLVEVWRDSKGAAWMLWLAARVGVDPKAVVLAKCDCARLALVHVPPDQHQPRLTIETVEAWQRGEATIAQVVLARHACDPVLRPWWDDCPFGWTGEARTAFAYAVSAAHDAAGCSGCPGSNPIGFAESALWTVIAVGAAAECAQGRAQGREAGQAAMAACAEAVRARIPVEVVQEALDAMLGRSCPDDYAGVFVYELHRAGPQELLGVVAAYVAEVGFASERVQ